MKADKPRITAQLAGRPLHPLFRPFVVGYFLATGACDLVYSQAGTFMQYSSPEFASITEWLLAAGLVMAAATAATALMDFLGDARFRALPGVGMYAFSTLLVVALELQNLYIRWAYGAAAIIPMGLTLSIAAAAVLLATPTQGWADLYRGADPAKG
ncbi:MAG TPA: DUF2231 domain-containing protein [Reyranella sp.]|nr:DUF2231 domain-containing protein [Reyranella sp.]